MKYLIIGLLILAIVSGCTTESNVENDQKNCQREAEKLIPAKLTLFQTDDGEWGLYIPKWNDGSEFVTSNFGGFSVGYLPGENVNHYYTRSNVDSDERGLAYNKAIISPEGEVLYYNQFMVNMVLQPVSPLPEQSLLDLIEQPFGNTEFNVLSYDFVLCSGFDRS